MTEKIIEANGEAEIETEHDLIPQQEAGVEADSMDALIEVAAKVGEFEKAMNTIMNFILRQSYAGDWVSHSRAVDPIHMRAANISGAGAERIAKSLGIREANWKRGEKVWTEDRKYYTFECEADFSLGTRTVHAYGRASSRDKFFGFANGQWKEISDVKEDDIKVAAFRNCRKEGVRTLLGLRKVPLMKLRELGFNLDLVQYVNFRSSKEAVMGQPSFAATTPAPQVEHKPTAPPPVDYTKAQEQEGDVTNGDTPKEWITVVIANAEAKVSKKGTPFYTVQDTDGTKYYLFAGANDPKAVAILTAYRDQKPVQIIYENDGKYTTIKEVKAI